MGLTDDPIYRNMTEGEDTHMLVGTLTTRMRDPNDPRAEARAVFLIDYYPGGDSVEPAGAPAFDGMKKVILSVKNGTYSVSGEERSTTLIFGGGEQAAHTAPDFWAEYTPTPEEHEAFQEAYRRTGVWVLMIITKPYLREYLVVENGDILFRRTIPLTAELRKTLKVQE